MKFRLGLILGFSAGYYFGTAAGRERHQQINRMLAKARRSDAYDAVTGKAKAVVDLSVERAKDLVETRVDARKDGPSGPIGAKGTTPVSQN